MRPNPSSSSSTPVMYPDSILRYQTPGVNFPNAISGFGSHTWEMVRNVHACMGSSIAFDSGPAALYKHKLDILWIDKVMYVSSRLS